MSFITPPANSSIWDVTGNSPQNITPFVGPSSAVDGVVSPVQVGGTNNTFQTVDASPGQTNQIVLSGANNQLIVGSGQQNIQAIGGGNIVESEQQILPDGTKIISVGTLGEGPSVFENGATVNESVIVSGNTTDTQATIDHMSGGLGGPFQGYAHGGTGDDLIYGSSGADFLRGGQGNDQIFAYDGNDVVRGGAGSDQIWLGAGDDYLYYTSDQMLGGDIDQVIDFTQGSDKLAFDAGAIGGDNNFTNFSGFGTDTLSIINSSGGLTKIVAVSENSSAISWQQTDIKFVV